MSAKDRDYSVNPLTVQERLLREMTNACHTGTGLPVMFHMVEAIEHGAMLRAQFGRSVSEDVSAAIISLKELIERELKET